MNRCRNVIVKIRKNRTSIQNLQNESVGSRYVGATKTFRELARCFCIVASSTLVCASSVLAAPVPPKPLTAKGKCVNKYNNARALAADELAICVGKRASPGIELSSALKICIKDSFSPVITYPDLSTSIVVYKVRLDFNRSLRDSTLNYAIAECEAAISNGPFQAGELDFSSQLAIDFIPQCIDKFKNSINLAIGDQFMCFREAKLTAKDWTKEDLLLLSFLVLNEEKLVKDKFPELINYYAEVLSFGIKTSNVDSDPSIAGLLDAFAASE